ncbi:MAG: hypothetical protein C0601_07100 [Candidatus Muiribacterium halophilum]|uniref:ABC transporter domain-containing protein n=1 Tax=Muiribacterium halophilum TaxID=2053465 RepID=A0A2N5ZFN3_MUIH1|nr:MAG: hypothetical protein C0601_07100 [Candidatus Muirbacterium halophilum]
MLHINGLKKQYGEKVLFKDLDLHLRRNDRLALVGDNGSGKSTLMKMIIGIEYPDDGNISVTGNIKTGYLPQFIHQDFDEGAILYDEVAVVFSNIFEKEKRLRDLENKM